VGETLFNAKKLAGTLPGGGAASTARLIVVVGAKLPAVPLIVTVAVPVGADPLTLKVSVLCELVLAGLKDAVTPVGNPLAVSSTLPEKPPVGFTVTLVDPLAFCCKATAAGAAESETPGCCRILEEDPAPPQPLAIKRRIETSENAPAPGDRETVPDTFFTDFINLLTGYFWN